LINKIEGNRLARYKVDDCDQFVNNLQPFSTWWSVMVFADAGASHAANSLSSGVEKLPE